MESGKIKHVLNMFKVRAEVGAGDKDVIHIYKTVRKSLKNLIHQPLEGASAVSETKRHPQPFKQGKRG